MVGDGGEVVVGEHHRTLMTISLYGVLRLPDTFSQFHLAPVAQHHRHRRRELQQGADGVVGPAAGAHPGALAVLASSVATENVLAARADRYLGGTDILPFERDVPQLTPTREAQPSTKSATAEVAEGAPLGDPLLVLAEKGGIDHTAKLHTHEFGYGSTGDVSDYKFMATRTSRPGGLGSPRRRSAG
jgi:hypothetical protein